ncbi:MAG TPA: amidase family protein [Alphaproteobacteria bacterium]|nr:amidase family protein [Alphaproteobacteria bacterium]
MTADDLCFLPAATLAGLIRRGELSPVELTEAVLARIETQQPRLNAFITVCAERALNDARAAETAVGRGDPLPPLHGVPMSVKDLLNTDGVATTFGSRLLAANVPEHDCLTVVRLKAAGAILVGKTTTPEFGHKPMTEGPLFGRTANPWDVTRTSGGSSGGAGAAVAAGLAPLAVGTDGGGSIRIPAACCGVVGLKPTLGVIPHDQAADGFGNLIYIGPMTRTVLDAALMLDAMAGPDACDPYAVHPRPVSYAASATTEGSLEGKRVAWRPFLGNDIIDPAVLQLAEAGAAALEELGASVERVEDDFENAEAHWLVITHSIWASRFRALAARGHAQMDPTLLAQMERGLAYSAVELQDALRWRTALFRRVQEWFDSYDLVATPTLARTAVPIGQDALGEVEIAGRMAGSLRGAWYPYTHPFNMTGHPAITLPCGLAPDGLPVGLQLIGRWHDEPGLLHAAALFEGLRPWAEQRPPDGP